MARGSRNESDAAGAHRGRLALACAAVASFAATAWAGDAPAPAPGAAAGAAAAGSPAVAPTLAPDAVWTIDRAVKAGLLRVRGERPGSYQSIDLVLESRASEPITVDVAGHHLRPTTGDPQRLGLSFPLRPVPRSPATTPGTYPIRLAAGERKTIRMNTCCMDSGRACPKNSDLYVLADSPTPPAVEVALRWWVDHPTAAQNHVNTAIWQSNPDLLLPPPDGGVRQGTEDPLPPPPPMPKGRSVKSFGGVAYLLDDGVLTSLNREGVRRFHATGIYSAWPTSIGLHAVAVGRTALELWRFGETGDPPWMRLQEVGRVDLEDVVPAGPREFLVRIPAGSGGRKDYALAHGGAIDVAALQSLNDALARVDDISLGIPTAAKGRAVLSFWTRGNYGVGSDPKDQSAPRAPKLEIYDVDLRTAKATHRKSFWNVRQARVGPAGVFGISPGKRLVRLDGERFVDMPLDEEWSEVVAVGTERILVRGAKTPLASLDVSSGRWIALPEGAAAASLDGVGTHSTLSVDPKTDQVVWLDGDVAKRWTPGAAEAEAIAFR